MSISPSLCRDADRFNHELDSEVGYGARAHPRQTARLIELARTLRKNDPLAFLPLGTWKVPGTSRAELQAGLHPGALSGVYGAVSPTPWWRPRGDMSIAKAIPIGGFPPGGYFTHSSALDTRRKNSLTPSSISFCPTATAIRSSKTAQSFDPTTVR